MQKQKVGIVILNFNNSGETLTCIQNVKKSTYDNVELIVVDNGSSENDIKILEKIEGINLILMNSNAGYAVGNNAGIKQAQKIECEFTMVLNNDVRIKSDTISKLVEVLKSHANIAFLGPVILEWGTQIIQSAGADNNFLRGTSDLINQGKLYNNSNQMNYVDYISGACMFFKTEIVKKIGFIPENYFLFFEENEWCIRALKKGFINVSTFANSVEHKGSATIDTVKGLSFYYMERNRVLFEKRNTTFFKYSIFLVYSVLRLFKKKSEFRQYLHPFIDGLFNTTKWRPKI